MLGPRCFYRLGQKILFVVTFCCSDGTFVFLTREEWINGSIHLAVVAA